MGWYDHTETRDGTGGQVDGFGRTDIRFSSTMGASAASDITVTGISLKVLGSR